MSRFVRQVFSIAASLAAVLSVSAFAQAPQPEPQLAPEGRGLLPRPSAATPQAPASANQFKPDPSGGFSRIVFETDENPDFKLVIRDYSFPPDKQSHVVTLPSAAVLHLLSGPGEISVAKRRLTLTPAARTAVPAGAPIEVVNNGDHATVVRALTVEAK